MTNVSFKIFCCICFYGACLGQSETHEGQGVIRSYKFIIEVPVTSCDITGECNGLGRQVADAGSVFSVVGERGDSLIIRFWKSEIDSAQNQRMCYEDSTCMKKRYFIIHESALKHRAIRRYDRGWQFTAGTVLIPVKLRLNNFDFSKDITLGPVAGAKYMLSNYSNNCISLVAGLGITSVTVTRLNEYDEEENVEVPALTPSLGIVFEFFNATQAGIFFGWDLISDQERENTIHYYKSWISFGLGFSILTKGRGGEFPEGD